MLTSRTLLSACTLLLLGAGIGGGLVHLHEQRQVRRNYLGRIAINSSSLIHQIDLLETDR